VTSFGHQLPLFDQRRVTMGERKRFVLAVLKDRLWHRGSELTAPDVGGSEGLRRLRELRAEGHDIEKRRAQDSDEYEYRLRCSP
jgi:hypothetical protein